MFVVLMSHSARLIYVVNVCFDFVVSKNIYWITVKAYCT